MVNWFTRKVTRKAALKVPLAEIRYHSPEVGVEFSWNYLRVVVPYHRLPVKADLGPILEHFKGELEGHVTFYLDIRAKEEEVEITDIVIEKEVIRRLNDFTGRLEEITGQIINWATARSLNIEKAQTFLYQYGFQYEDIKAQDILAAIIDPRFPRKVHEKISFPLSSLHYVDRGIQFFFHNYRFDVAGERLPIEVGPALEEVKGHFDDDIHFEIEIVYLQRWDRERSELQSAHISHDVITVELSPQLLELYKTFRGRMVCGAITQLTTTQPVSVERVGMALKRWGLDLKHRDIALEIMEHVPAWTEEKDIIVALKDLIYHDDAVSIPVEDRHMRISAKSLPFNTAHRLDELKTQFIGEIKLHIYQPYRFAWQEEEQRLVIEKNKSIKIKIHIEDDALNQLKGYYRGLEENEPAPQEEKEEQKEEQKEPERTEEPETPEKSEETDEITFPLGDLPRPIKKVPASELETKDYDAPCIRALEEMADGIYITNKDLWFRINNRLIWERPVAGSATYVFEWPEEELEFFVGKIRISDLQEIRNDRDTSGYIGRVSHSPDNLSRWKSNLKRNMKKQPKWHDD